MNRPRLLKILTMLSLALCTLTILAACIAGLFPKQHWTITWTDTGTVITKKIEAYGWNWRGATRYEHIETFSPGGDPNGMAAVRDYLTAITPVNKPYAIPVHDRDRYFIIHNDNLLQQSVSFESRGQVLYDISTIEIVILSLLLPIGQFGAMLVRRGRAAQQREAATTPRHGPTKPAVSTRPSGIAISPIKQWIVHWRARCPQCDAFIPRSWVWRASRREHRCAECHTLLRETMVTRHVGNLGLFAVGFVAIVIAINVVHALTGSQNLAMVSAIMILFAVGLLAYAAYPYITRFENTAPRCNCCGYNLTANTSGVCPECGTAATS